MGAEPNAACAGGDTVPQSKGGGLDRAERDEMITSNLGLARHLARRFTDRGESYEDLVQVASMALIKAADRFDPDRGVQFSTFAAKTIIGELKRHFRDRGWAVRAPRRIQELYLELTSTADTLSQELGRSPTISDLAKATGATEESVLEALEAGHGYRATSIDSPDRSDNEPLAERLGEPDVQFAGVEDRLALFSAIGALPMRERQLVYMRFFEGLTQSEIAARIGMSQMHVSRLLGATVQRLRLRYEAGA